MPGPGISPELAEMQDRLTELVPETAEECEQVAEQAAEIQADPRQKLIEQLTGWLMQIMNRLDDVAAKYRTGIGLTVLAWLRLFVVPQADVDRMALFCVAAAAFLMLVPAVRPVRRSAGARKLGSQSNMS